MENKQFNSFAAAARHYFGFQPGKGLQDFMAELRSLTPTDKVELADGMARHGIVIASASKAGE